MTDLYDDMEIKVECDGESWTTTVYDFIEANPDDAAEIRAKMQALFGDGTPARFGGGSAPMFTVTR